MGGNLVAGARLAPVVDDARSYRSAIRVGSQVFLELLGPSDIPALARRCRRDGRIGEAKAGRAQSRHGLVVEPPAPRGDFEILRRELEEAALARRDRGERHVVDAIVAMDLVRSI